MGTKVQCKSYFPVGYHMRDLNEDSDSSWSRYYEDKTLSGHLYNGFALRPVNGYSEYDKEMLKRTMLEHEAIFRRQVYELHRLYSIQKDLMDEFQKKGLYRHYLPADTSPSKSFSSQMPPEGTKRIWQMPHQPVGSSSYGVTPVAGIDDMRRPLKFLEENSMQSGRFPIENGSLLKDNNLQQPIRRFPGRMLDLQLPADVYIDTEEANGKEKENVARPSFGSTVPFYNICGAGPGSDLKLTLGTGECSSRQEDSWKSDSHKQNGFPAHNLADLNEPIGEICRKVAAGSTSTHFLGPKTHCEENQRHQFPMRSNTSYIRRDNVEGSCSNFMFADKEEIRRECPFYNNGAGDIRSSTSFFNSDHSKKLPMLSRSIELKPTKTQEISLPNKADAWFRQKPTLGIEISGRSPHLASSNNSGPVAPGTPSSFSLAPNLDYSCTGSPLVSASTEPVNSTSHIPIAVQGLPCFNIPAATKVQSKRFKNAIQDSSNACDKWQHECDLRPHMRLGGEASSYSNGFQLDSSSELFGKSNLNSKVDTSAFGNSEGLGPQKCSKGLQCTDASLNQAPLNRIRDGITSQHDIGISSIEAKCHVSSWGISWLARKPACNEFVDLNKYASQIELDFSQGYPQLISSSSVVDPELEGRQEEENGHCKLQDVPSTSRVENIMMKNEAYDSLSGKKILGFPIFDKIQQNAICSPSHQERSVTDYTKGRKKDGSSYIDLPPDIKAPSLEKEIPVGSPVRTNSRRCRNHINLNSACMDDPYPSEISPEFEVEDPLLLSVAAKVGSETDLEEFMPSIKADGLQGTECSHETLVREAAENIVRMSSDKCSLFGSILFRRVSPVPCDSLQWFAEVVVSSAAECAGVLRGGDGSSQSSDDGLDHFELMTLKLEETKPDEYFCRPRGLGNQKEDEKGDASLLLTRPPRRGQVRKRRQRRDFQKDILPGLASLSKLEVTEDIQIIGGLMKASGCSWEKGSTRRNAGRNGLNSQARGRRRPRSLAVTVAEIHVSPPPTQTTDDVECRVDGRSMIGWGRTTRRCRRPRCPPVNISAPLI